MVGKQRKGAPRPGGEAPFDDRPEARTCDGWPEIGECDNAARRGSDYCRQCDEIRLAHEGRGLTEEDEDGQ